MTVVGFNNRVPCKPPELEGAKLDVSTGFGRLLHRSALTGLTVIYPFGTIPAGAVVYVKAPDNQQWAKEKFSIGDDEFILVPLEQILLVKCE